LSILIFGRRGRWLPLLFIAPPDGSLHDLLVGSTVVRDRAKAAPLVPLWKGHLAITAVIVGLVALTALIRPRTVWTHSTLAGLLRVVKASRPRAKFDGDGRNRPVRERAGRGGYFTVTAVLTGKPDSPDAAANRLAAIVMKEFPTS